MFNVFSSYRADPEGWLANQTGHVTAGICLAFVVCLLYWRLFGEMPVRLIAWGIVATGYLLFEVIKQGWRGADTIEDWIFVVCYGAGAPLYAFKEVDPVTGAFGALLPDLEPFFMLLGFHLTLGAGIRTAQRHRANG